MPNKTAGRGSPRLKPQPAPLPLVARPVFRRGIVVALSVLTMLGGVRVWVNAERSHALATYVRALERAERPFLIDIDPASKANIGEVSRTFGQAKISSKTFKVIADQWEKDFRLAKDRVAALHPPRALEQAQKEMVQGLEMYAGVARLLHVAGQLREVGAIAKGNAQARIEEKVIVELQHAQEWQARAEAVFGLGGAQLAALRKEWLGTEPASPVPGVPAGISPTAFGTRTP